MRFTRIRIAILERYLGKLRRREAAMRAVVGSAHITQTGLARLKKCAGSDEETVWIVAVD